LIFDPDYLPCRFQINIILFLQIFRIKVLVIVNL
jgi:hypothetical protein